MEEYNRHMKNKTEDFTGNTDNSDEQSTITTDIVEVLEKKVGKKSTIKRKRSFDKC